MTFSGELAIGGLDLSRSCGMPYPKNLVIIDHNAVDDLLGVHLVPVLLANYYIIFF